MATYEVLKQRSAEIEKFSQVSWDADRVVRAMKHIEFDRFYEHVPSMVSMTSKMFYDKYKDKIPEIVYYPQYDNPEDERDDIAHNYALCRLPELMLYLEEVNKHLTPEQVNDPQYSHHILHLGTEILMAKDSMLEDDQIQYLCAESVPKDYMYYGCKHYEYAACQARWWFDSGYSVDEVRKLQAVPSHADTAVRLYVDDCSERSSRIDFNKIDCIVASKDDDEAYEVYSALRNGSSFEDVAVARRQADKLVAAAADPALNRKVVETFKSFGGEREEPMEFDKFSERYRCGYIESYCDLLREGRLTKETADEFTDMFIHDIGSNERFPSYYMDALEKEGDHKFPVALAKPKVATRDLDLPNELPGKDDEQFGE